jgi:uncharacterized protein
MPGALFDTNAWLAAIFTSHPLHALAQDALQSATPSEPAIFCRSTQQSFLRLASTPALLKVYGAVGMVNRDALAALDALQALPQVRVAEEPPGVFELWRRFAELSTTSPKVWMDAYLAAFAVAGGLRMVTLDGGFRTFVAQGLALTLIKP